jgi:hypothetical protein
MAKPKATDAVPANMSAPAAEQRFEKTPFHHPPAFAFFAPYEWTRHNAKALLPPVRALDSPASNGVSGSSSEVTLSCYS